MNDDAARLTPDEEEDLIGAVIRRTSGGACRRAEELLVARFEVGSEASAEAPAGRLAATPGSPAPTREDGEAPAGRLAAARDSLAATPEDTDRALLDAHLAHCAACAALARSLAVAAETLPSLAAFDPGPSFTAAVLAATSRAEVEEVRLKPDATYLGRLAALWNAWLARPRFAYEVAYVATILVLVIVGNPASRLQAASERTVIAAAAGFERAREAWPAAVARVVPSVELPAGVRALGSATQSLIAERAAAARGTNSMLDRVLSQWSVTWDWIRGVASDAASRAWSTLTGIRQAVSGLFSRPPTEPGKPAAR